MKLYKQAIVWAVCIAMVLSLCACRQEPVQTTPTTQPTTAPTPTTEPTQPTETTVYVPTAEEIAEMYTSALAAFQQQPSVMLKFTTFYRVNVAGEELVAQAEQVISAVGLDSETPVIKVEDTTLYGDHEVEMTEIFTGGVVYADVNDFTYSAQMPLEQFEGTLMTAAMLDPALYGEIVLTEGEDGSTIDFAQPSAIEKWLAMDSARVIEASGTAKLDASGALTGSSYTADFAYGGLKLHWEISMEILPLEKEPTAPKDPESYVLLNSLEGPQLLEAAYGYLMQTDHFTVRYSESYMIEAAAFVQNRGITLDSWGEGEDIMMQSDQTVFQMDFASGQEYSLELKETYRDGKFTSVTDGGRPQVSNKITDVVMREYMMGMLLDNIPQMQDVAQVTAYPLGSVYLLEFTMTQEHSDATKDTLLGSILVSPDALDKAASKFEHVEDSFYLSIDGYTMLPVAMGMKYEVEHTLQGDPYSSSMQIDYAIDIGSLSAYENITEEILPDVEPEEKATPLFYHVTGENGQEMWLFGTIHVGDDRTGFLPQEIYDAFDAADALAIECDTQAFEEKSEEDEELQEQVSDLYYYSDGTTTKDHITDPELYEAALRLLKATGGYNMNSEYLKPHLWENLFDNFFMSQSHGICGEKGVEERLVERAHDQEKPIREVESVIEQMEVLTGYSDELQEHMLAESVEDGGVDYWVGLDKLYNMWCEGDEAALIEYLKDDTSEMTEEEQKLYEEYNNAMSVNRNAGMLEVAKEYLESGDVVFYAVGLAHLLAEDGLVNTLREAGYTVELVTYAE